MNIKQGDILESKYGVKHKVLGICGEAYFLADSKGSYYCGSSKEQIEKEFKISKEKWVPKVGEKYWFMNKFFNVDNKTNELSDIDVERIQSGNCFHTESEALEIADKFKALLANRE